MTAGSEGHEVPLTHPETSADTLEEGRALCLSGGGYRAMVFHTGALWRLNEAGFLPRLERISSVSGGSIAAGVLAARWPRLEFDANGRAVNLKEEVVGRIRGLAGRTIDRRSVLGGLLLPGSAGNCVARAYRKHLFGGATLRDLPERPRFVINATNVQTGDLWRFSKPYMGSWRVGRVFDPDLPLATAVAASSAFPPVLSPVRLPLDPDDFRPGEPEPPPEPPFRRRVVLSDGGVYDNLGLETVWKRYTDILVSDGGGQFRFQARPKRNWLCHTVRVLGVIDNQVRSLRKRQLIGAYRNGDRGGAYWGIGTHIADYGLPDAMEAPADVTRRLAEVSTRLKRLRAALQERLINWGFAVCDAALRRHVEPGLAMPEGFPYPRGV